MNKVTAEDIKRFNELYHLKYHTYAGVARETGFSASTVTKYIDKNWKPVDEASLKRVHLSDVKELDLSIFEGLDNYGKLCFVDGKEREEVIEFWKELSV